MIPLSIKLDADGAYPEAKELGNVTSVGLLHHGTVSGKGSVVVEIVTPDGSKVYGQTTLALFHMAAAAMKARDEVNQQAASASH